jgi:hypothetical protein
MPWSDLRIVLLRSTGQGQHGLALRADVSVSGPGAGVVGGIRRAAYFLLYGPYTGGSGAYDCSSSESAAAMLVPDRLGCA